MKKFFSKKFLAHHGFFLAILFLATFLRFYRLKEMVYFDFDQEYAANFAYSVLREFPLQLIGQGLSVQGLFMGPLYFYYLVPFFALFRLHPLGGAVGSVILGLITATAYYYFGNRLFGRPAGLIGAFLRAVLFSKLEADWAMVPAYSSELLVLVTWYLFYQYWQGETKFLPFLAFVFGLYTSFHPILFPFYLVFLILLILRQKWPRFRTLALSLGAFILPLAPLILFEYWHRFLEVKRLVELFSKPGAESTAFSLARVMNYLAINLTGLEGTLGLKFNPPYFLSGLVLLGMIVLTIRRISFGKERFHLVVLGMTILSFIGYYYFFPIHIPEYYFLGPITLLFFCFIGLLGYLWTIRPLARLGVVILLTWLTLLNFKSLYQKKWTYPSLTTLAHKEKMVKEVLKRQLPDEAFSVSYISSPGWDFGFAYLFKLAERLPQDREKGVPIYTVVMPKSLSEDSINVSSGNIGLILPDEKK